ncbi:MAG: hypothetical protein JWM14_3304 [Chitinophagaceae bacterium]|nr:hypothetical protein [Chitinophagaceae bacterium]
MMYKLLIVLGLMVVNSSLCSAQKKIPYEFPPAMKEPVRLEYEKLADKGQVLWNINCASCHNTKVRGKVIVPDFTPEQLKGYELRITNPQHESGIPETTVSTEELGLIMTFLAYKKKNK